MVNLKTDQFAHAELSVYCTYNFFFHVTPITCFLMTDRSEKSYPTSCEFVYRKLKKNACL